MRCLLFTLATLACVVPATAGAASPPAMSCAEAFSVIRSSYHTRFETCQRVNADTIRLWGPNIVLWPRGFMDTVYRVPVRCNRGWCMFYRVAHRHF